MAKTIKEMAVKESENYLGEAFEQGNFADGYIAGANAVLEKIEYMLRQHYTTFNATATDVLNKIKELKGE